MSNVLGPPPSNGEGMTEGKSEEPDVLGFEVV